MPLTITIPVSLQGLPRLKASIDSMEFLGGLQKHSVVFCCAPSVQTLVAEDAARIRAICPNTFLEVLPREPEPRGRFGAFNSIFRDCVEILAKKNKNPWLWWEEDMTAILGGWADRLELEYHQKGKPFLGVRRHASDVVRGANGQKLPDDDPRIQGDYMVAVGIYPPNFKDGYSTMYRYPDPTGSMPADVQIRHEVNKHLQHTDLIGHHFKTCNYRRENGKIVCDDFEYTEGWPKYGGEVSPMAYVVHGDKSGTLSALILAETPTNVTQSGIVTTAPVDNSELVSLRAENKQMRDDIQRMNEAWSKKEMEYSDEIESLKERTAIPITASRTITATVEGGDVDAEITVVPLPDINLIRKAVQDSSVKRMLGDWAADFKINKDELRKMIESPESGLRIKKPGPPFVTLAA